MAVLTPKMGRRALAIVVGALAAMSLPMASANATELLVDGGFESAVGDDSPGWTELSFAGGTADICAPLVSGCTAPDAAHSGSKWVQFGGVSDGSFASISQDVLIPNTGSATLSFWLWWRVAGSGDETLVVSIDGTTLATRTPANVGAGYVKTTLLEDSFANGQMHTVKFRLDNPLGGGPADAVVNLDDISLTDTVPPPNPPTVTGVDPPSGGDNNAPKVMGTVGPGTSTVQIYTDAACTTAIGSPESPATFTGAGIQVSVPDNSSTDFYAKASGPGGSSDCSTTSVHYDEVSPKPPVSNPGPTGTGQRAAALKKCKKKKSKKARKKCRKKAAKLPS